MRHFGPTKATCTFDEWWEKVVEEYAKPTWAVEEPDGQISYVFITNEDDSKDYKWVQVTQTPEKVEEFRLDMKDAYRYFYDDGEPPEIALALMI